MSSIAHDSASDWLPHVTAAATIWLQQEQLCHIPAKATVDSSLSVWTERNPFFFMLLLSGILSQQQTDD